MLIFTKESRVLLKILSKKGMGNKVLSIIMNTCYFNTELGYRSDIKSASNIVTLKEDMCHTLQNTGC